MTIDRQCNECGSTDWSKVLDTHYPERRRDRDQTVKTVYACKSCDAEGKEFDQQNSGTVQYSGALR